MYPLLSLKETLKYEKDAEIYQVSEIARSKDGFLSAYKKYGKNLPEEWIKKRYSFISRTLPAYLKSPSYRRWLSLIIWGYYIEPPKRFDK